MLSQREILDKLGKAKAELASRFTVQRIGLFGSCARGDSGPDSDIDILVDVDPSIGLEFVSLADRIEELLGSSVDLVSRRALNARSRTAIEQDIIYV